MQREGNKRICYLGSRYVTGVQLQEYLAINRGAAEGKWKVRERGSLFCTRNTHARVTRASCTGVASVTVGQVRGEWPESGGSRASLDRLDMPIVSQFIASIAEDLKEKKDDIFMHLTPIRLEILWTFVPLSIRRIANEAEMRNIAE